VQRVPGAEPAKHHREQKCADTVGTVLVLHVGWAFPKLTYRYILQIKYAPWASDIDRLLHGALAAGAATFRPISTAARRSAANASSVVFMAT